MRRMVRVAAGACGLGLVAATVPAVWGGWTPSPGPTVIVDSNMGKTNLAIAASSATDGDAVAVWGESSAAGTALKASVRHNGTWSAPATLDDGEGTQSVDPRVVVDQNGFATAVWVRRDNEGVNKLWSATRPAAGPWSAAAEISPGIQAERLSVAITPAGEVTAVWQSPSGGGVSAADKAAGATTWTVTQVAAVAGSPWVAAAPNGRTAIAYNTISGLLAVKVRTGTGSWADVTAESASANRPETVAVDVAHEPMIAFGADNTLHAAWWEYENPDPEEPPVPLMEQIHTSSRSSGGVWTVHPTAISAPNTITHVKGIAGDASGNVTVVWHSQQISPTSETRYFAATRVAGTWEAPYPLTGANPGEGLSTPHLVVDPDGMFTASWGQGFAAKANRRIAAGDWLETAENLSEQSASFVAAANDSSGEPMLAWTRFNFDGTFHYRVETRTYDSSAPPGDTTGPVTTMTKPTKAFYLARNVPVAWTAEDDLGTVEASKVRFRSAAWNGDYPTQYTNLTTFFAGTSMTYGTQPGFTYCFQAQSQDDVPNTGDWSGDACTATPVDDRRPARAGTWTKLTSSKFYRGTALKSTDQGATLTLAGAQGKRISLVVTRCQGCGKVAVKFAGETLGTWSLAASSTQNKVVIPVHLAADVETGNIVVKVVSADGKKVQLDGILVGRV